MTAKGIQPRGAYEEIRSVQKQKKIERTIKYLRPEEVHRLLEYVDLRACLRDQAVIYVLLDGGVRRDELVDLDVGDVDFERGELKVREGREREVPLPTRAARRPAWKSGRTRAARATRFGRNCTSSQWRVAPTEMVDPPDIGSIPGFAGITPVTDAVQGVQVVLKIGPLFVGEKGRLVLTVCRGLCESAYLC